MNEDLRLREQIQSLRRADQARGPSFEAVMRRIQRRSAAGLFGRIAIAALVMAAIAVTWIQGARRPASLIEGGAAPMLADWRAPTDFLLITPGWSLLNSVPELGHYPSAPVTPPPTTQLNTPAHHTGRRPS